MNNVSHNNITLQSYEQGVSEYIDGTAAETSGSIKAWIDNFLNLLPLTARIIEIGSAFGRDAQYIESRGFSVKRTDATIGFVNLLQSKGYAANQFNILTDDFNSLYELIFANAVFLHFNPVELNEILKKAHKSLSDDGILAFSVKHGEGEEWTSAKIGSPRYFCYWQKDTIQSLLESLDFEVLLIHEDEKFLQITAKRKQAEF